MTLKVALAQMAPVWLDREATLEKIVDQIDQAAGAVRTWSCSAKPCCRAIRSGPN